MTVLKYLLGVLFQFEEKEKKRAKEENLRLESKHQRQTEDLNAKNDAILRELEQAQVRMPGFGLLQARYLAPQLLIQIQRILFIPSASLTRLTFFVCFWPRVWQEPFFGLYVSFQKEKQVLLMDHEKKKIAELEHSYEADLEEWRKQLGPRKQVGFWLSIATILVFKLLIVSVVL